MKYFTYLFKYLAYLFLTGMAISAIINLIISLTKANDHLLLEIVIILLYILIVSIFGFLFYFHKKSIWQFLSVPKKRRLLYLIGTVILIIWQIVMIINLTTYVGWDPQQTLLSVVDRPHMQGWLYDYLSYCPNNLSLYYLFVFIRKFCSITHLPSSMLTINYFNMIIMDIAFLLLILAIKHFTNNRIISLLGFATILFLLGFSPWIIVTYTDTLSLLPVSLGLLALALLIRKRNYYTAILFGLSGSLCFFVKPSSSIYYIAAIIILILVSIIHKNWANIILTALACLTTFLVSISIQLFNTHQTMYPIDSSVTLPATHYLMMGAQGNGSYNLQDVLSDINDPDKANLPHKNITKYCQRVKKMGIIGYSKFLINKFYWTNNDGSLGWGVEGGPDFINQNIRPYSADFGGLLRRFYWPLGDWSWMFYAIAQLIWISATILLVFSFRAVDYLSEITKNWLYLTIFGNNLFLLLFEAGRSRFLIQFLPILIFIIALSLYFLLFKDQSLSHDSVDSNYSVKIN